MLQKIQMVSFQTLSLVHDLHLCTLNSDQLGLSDPYVVVKYGQDVMFKTQVVKKSLNPDWHKSVTLSAPPPDKIIIVVSAPKSTEVM